MTTALDMYEATPTSDNDCAEFDFNGYHVELTVPNDAVLRARFTCSMSHPDCTTMYILAKDYLEQYLSETTNNDSCHITIDERSAHFEAGDPHRIEVIATIHDYLT